MCVKEMEKGTTCVHPLFVLVGFACRLIPGASLTHFMISGTHKPARRAGSKLEGFWLLGLQLGGGEAKNKRKTHILKFKFLHVPRSHGPGTCAQSLLPPTSRSTGLGPSLKESGSLAWRGGAKNKKNPHFSKLKTK